MAIDVEITAYDWVQIPMPPPMPPTWRLNVTVVATITPPPDVPGCILQGKWAKIRKQNGVNWNDITMELAMNATGNPDEYTASFSIQQPQVNPADTIDGYVRASWMAAWEENSDSDNEVVPGHA
jgi:hypothetical protein